MTSFLKRLLDSAFPLELLMIFIIVSSSSNECLNEVLKSSIVDKKVFLKRFNRETVSLPYYEVKNFIDNKFSVKPEIIFELYPDFIFISEYFSDILNKDNLKIEITFNDELVQHVNTSKINPTGYIDKFLKHLPHTQNLTYLKLSNLYLTEIPKKVYELNDLKILNLRSNDLENFKIDINQLSKLEELIITGNKSITRIDDSICNLSHLKILKANNCSITEIPPSFCNLKNLEHLDLSENPVSFLPSPSNLKKLTELHISGCAFNNLLIDLSELTQLSFVDLNRNSSLTSLKLLNFDDTQRLKNIKIKNCPAINVEVCLNLKTDYFTTIDSNYYPLENSQYVIKFDPSEVKNCNTFIKVPKFKIFRIYS